MKLSIKKKNAYQTNILKSDNKMKFMWNIDNQILRKYKINISGLKDNSSTYTNEYNDF